MQTDDLCWFPFFTEEQSYTNGGYVSTNSVGRNSIASSIQPTTSGTTEVKAVFRSRLSSQGSRQSGSEDIKL